MLSLLGKASLYIHGAYLDARKGNPFQSSVVLLGMASTNQTIEKAYCQFWQKSGFYEVERVRKHTEVRGDRSDVMDSF